MKTLQTNRGMQPHGFTQTDLLDLLTVLALLALVVLPALANTRPRSARVICANNLRQIGMAMHFWGNEHSDRPPWEVPPVEGGTRQHALAPNAWDHFAWISNELASPRLLFCPSDIGQSARDFTGDPAGGYLHPNFANRATSYFLAHTGASSEWNTHVQSGDRNISGQGLIGGCPRFTSVWSSSLPARSSTFYWTAAMHGDSGNALNFDGAVAQMTSEGLRQKFNERITDAGSIHVVLPR
jgi:hypothetical protein